MRAPDRLVPLVAALAAAVFLGSAADAGPAAQAGGAAPPPPAAAGRAGDAVVVSAAVSLTEALDTLAREFERERGIPVLVNFGASNILARQIAEGAPVDLFISADPDQMRVAEAAGRLVPGSQVPLLSNRLVVLVPPDGARSIHAVGDLLSPSVRRIAAGDPTAVPAGAYTRRYLESLGLWSALAPKIVPGVSVRAALAAIDAGEVDAAFVYRTDAAVARRAVMAFEVPAGQAPPIIYPAALIAGARHPAAARDLLEYLQGPASMAVFERHGFIPAPAPPPAPPELAAPAPGAGAQPALDWAALWQIGRFTVLVALAATALMLPPAIALAWLLARGRFHGKVILETLVSLPLVLPPVATGVILLDLLGRRGPFGAILANGGIDIVFTWKAVVLAMAAMGFPLVVRTARTGFEQVTRRYEQVAETLGAGPLRVFFTISLPLASRNVVAGGLLGFSRALGEFGATIVVAGSLPGRTRTIAVAMFNFIETGRDAQAGVLLLVSVAIAFAAVWLSNVLARGQG
jgi:molybdate transport system permease protein